ncbi:MULTISPECIES: hypothetical protein [Actinomycetes]|uniref:Uncharacterized protein n=2 Tax=Actinomycetes TaxID=1760 RepID=A0ABP6M1G6_9MICC
MVEQPNRGEQEQRLVAALRGTFDVSVMNFGSYNILYAANLEANDARAVLPGESADSVQDAVSMAEHLLVGYRRQPTEIVLCPVDLAEAMPRITGAAADPADDATPRVPLPVNMTNLAGMAAEGDAERASVTIALSTGHRVVLDVRGRVSFDELPEVTLDQRRDVRDFTEFVDFFLDRLEDMNPV